MKNVCILTFQIYNKHLLIIFLIHKMTLILMYCKLNSKANLSHLALLSHNPIIINNKVLFPNFFLTNYFLMGRNY